MRAWYHKYHTTEFQRNAEELWKLILVISTILI